MVNTSLEQRDWHAMPAADVLRALDTAREGLDSGQVERRLKRQGPNQMPRRD
jgi:hypothetical protein